MAGGCNLKEYIPLPNLRNSYERSTRAIALLT